MTRRPAILAILAVALLGGCGYATPSVDDPGEAVGGPPAVAQGIVEGWFDAVILDAPDLGWRFIYPSLRESVFGSEKDYRASLLESDWSQVSYRVDHVGLRDGEYTVEVELRVDGEASPPAFLQRWGFMQFREAAEPGPIRGFVTVSPDPPKLASDSRSGTCKQVLFRTGMMALRNSPSNPTEEHLLDAIFPQP